MDQHVPFEVATKFEGMFTVVTYKGLRSRMSENVLLEVPSCFEILITLPAVEKSFVRMNQHVLFEVACTFAGVFTQCTTKGLLSPMNLQVSLQEPNIQG